MNDGDAAPESQSAGYLAQNYPSSHVENHKANDDEHELPINNAMEIMQVDERHQR